MAGEIPASELIRLCRAGEPGARESLFDRYQAYLQVLARAQLGRHLRGKCDPSDVVQMTLLEAHRDFAAFQGSHEPELLAWLRRILAHNLFNEARHFAAQQRDSAREVSLDQVRAGVEHSSVALAGTMAADTPSPSQLASQRESAVRLADALSRLPDDYQTVLLFARGIARRGGVAHGWAGAAAAVRMLQMRALGALREQMGAQAE